MGVLWGGQEVSDFFEGKWYVLGIFLGKSYVFAPRPPEKSCPPLEKSLQTSMAENI